jgi:hypothetical protein
VNHQEAILEYEAALEIAQDPRLHKEEAEVIIHLGSARRENMKIENLNINLSSIEKTLLDLGYAARISKNNPYLSASISLELARLYEDIAIDVAQRHCEQALTFAEAFELFLAEECRKTLERIVQAQQPLINEEYELENQPWYLDEFPKTQPIDNAKIESLGFKADFVILTATGIELKTVLQLLTPYQEEEYPFRHYTSKCTYYLGTFGV